LKRLRQLILSSTEPSGLVNTGKVHNVTAKVKLAQSALRLCRPTDLSYGVALDEVGQALLVARETGAALYFVRGARTLTPQLLCLRCEGVSVLKDTRWRRIAYGGLLYFHAAVLPRMRTLAVAGQRTIHATRARLWREVSRATRRDKHKKESAKLKAKAAKEAMKNVRAQNAVEDIHRRLTYGFEPIDLQAKRPLRSSLYPAAENEARRRANALGIDDQAKVVLMHAREGGYRNTRNLYDDNEFDKARNIDINTYGLGAAFLHERGYTIIRIGDASMQPVHWPGVIDLARTPDPILEFYLACRSELMVLCDSGPSAYSMLLPNPMVRVNVISPFGSYPIGSRDLYILKRPRDPSTGIPLSLREVNSDKPKWNRWPADAYIDNSPEEIRDVIVEALDGLANPNPKPPTLEQAAFRQEMERHLYAPERIREKRHRERRGTDRPALGMGRIGAAFARAYWR
jgi:putative glycosyltransferase (TIGR04372 family)